MSSPEPHQGNFAALVLTFATVVVATLLSGAVLHTGAASAETSNPCIVFDKAIELSDGSVVAVGPTCLVKLDSSGKLVSAFGSGGIAPLAIPSSNGYGPDGGWVIEILKQGDDFLVVTNTSLIRFLPDGRRDPNFGEDGRLRISPSQSVTSIVDTTLSSDGSIFLAGFGTVTKLTPDGHLDPSFGIEGTYKKDNSSPANLIFQRISLDGAGRVLAAGYTYGYPDGPRAAIIRLTTAGVPDASFGSSGRAISAPVLAATLCYDSCQLYVTSIDVDLTGDINLAGYVDSRQVKSSATYAFSATFDDDGEDGSVSATDNLPSWAPFHVDPAIGLAVSSFSSNSVTGNRVAAGNLTGFTGEPCENYCAIYRGAIAKVNATTGSPVVAFGTDGVAMPSRNECAGGDAPNVPHLGPWIPCRIVSPRVFAKGAFRQVRTRRPEFTMSVSLSDLPNNPLFPTQTIAVELPSKLRLTKKALKTGYRLSYESGAEGTYSASLKGRAVMVTFTPKVISYEGNDYVDPKNEPLHLTLRLKRGALRPIAKKDRGKRLRFVAKATLVPPESDSARWGETTALDSFKASPLPRKR